MPYSLIDDPWLPVLRHGDRQDVSLRTALHESQDIAGLALTAPTQMVAVLRQVLLPVVMDALGAPGDTEAWAARRAQPLDAERLDAYFEEHLDRFNVFDPVAPFAQVAGLQAESGETKPSSLLVPALPTGNNVPLFGARTEADPPPLPWPEAIRRVLEVLGWDTAGIKSGALGDPQVKSGKTTGNHTGPLGALGVVVLVGPTLHDTLLLNLPIIPPDPRPGAAQSLDRPQWRRPPAGPEWSERDADGLLDLWTWQERRICLIPTVDEETGATVVEQVVIAAGDRLLATPDYEPHTSWTVKSGRNGQPSTVRPRRHRSGRAAWRGLDGIVAGSQTGGDQPGLAMSRLLAQVGQLQAEQRLPYDFPLGVETVGVEYGTQSAVVENVIHDSIPVPVRALWADSDVGEAVERLALDTNDVVKAVDMLQADLCRALGGDLVPWDKGERASERVVYRLDGPARRVLAGLQREPQRVDEAMLAWSQAARQAARETADELLSAVPPQAVTGRVVGGRPQRASLAEIRFLAQLRKILPMEEHDVAASTEG